MRSVLAYGSCSSYCYQPLWEKLARPYVYCFCPEDNQERSCQPLAMNINCRSRIRFLPSIITTVVSKAQAQRSFSSDYLCQYTLFILSNSIWAVFIHRNWKVHFTLSYVIYFSLPIIRIFRMRNDLISFYLTSEGKIEIRFPFNIMFLDAARFHQTFSNRLP